MDVNRILTELRTELELVVDAIMHLERLARGRGKRRFRESLKAEDLADGPLEWDPQWLGKIQSDLPVFPEACCYLGEDWDFESIVQEAQRGSGHRFWGRQIRSFQHQILRICYDLADALHRQHLRIQAKAVADFWRSSQVLHHIDSLTLGLENLDSRILGRLAGADFVLKKARYISFAWTHVYQELYCYGDQVIRTARQRREDSPAIEKQRRRSPQQERNSVIVSCLVRGVVRPEICKTLDEKGFPTTPQMQNQGVHRWTEAWKDPDFRKNVQQTFTKTWKRHRPVKS